MGDVLPQKTYTVDFLTKKRVTNNGVVTQYYVENSHEAIIPKEIFMQVQEELVRRSTCHVSSSGKKRNLAVAIRSHILFSTGNVERYIAECIGITVARNLLYSDVLAD